MKKRKKALSYRHTPRNIPKSISKALLTTNIPITNDYLPLKKDLQKIKKTYKMNR